MRKYSFSCRTNYESCASFVAISTQIMLVCTCVAVAGRRRGALFIYLSRTSASVPRAEISASRAKYFRGCCVTRKISRMHIQAINELRATDVYLVSCRWSIESVPPFLARVPIYGAREPRRHCRRLHKAGRWLPPTCPSGTLYSPCLALAPRDRSARLARVSTWLPILKHVRASLYWLCGTLTAFERNSNRWDDGSGVSFERIEHLLEQLIFFAEFFFSFLFFLFSFFDTEKDATSFWSTNRLYLRCYFGVKLFSAVALANRSYYKLVNKSRIQL